MRVITAFLMATLATPAMAGPKFLDEMKAAAQAGLNPKVRGRVQLSDGKVLTCFVNVRAGYIGPPDMQSPAYNVRDPRTGHIAVQTGAIPSVVWLPPATLASNNCDELDKMGVLKPDGAAPPEPAATAPSAPVIPGGKVRDAATLCKISPALALSLQDEAMQFVRIDRGKILMNEKRLGKRAIMALDSEDFAQRATEAAAGIAARGPSCGKAFWDNEAIQAASNALQSR